MADVLATPDDLRKLLGEDATSLSDADAELLLELATGGVQGAARQDLVYRPDDVAEIMGTTDSWLDLPQRPVVSVSTVKIEGETVTDYKKFGARLWRRCGWAQCAYEPSQVEVTYTHGYLPGDPGVQFARAATLTTAAQMLDDPTGKRTGMSIDDYREQYSQAGGDDLADLVPSGLRKSLRRRYGKRGGLVRIG